MSNPAFTLGLLKIPVSDITTSLRFYTAGLGFVQEFVAEEYGWAQLQAGAIPIALYKPGMGGGNRTPGGSVDFHLSSKDLLKIKKSLQDHYPASKAEIFKNDDGSETLEFADPDGNEFKISKG